MFIARIDGKYQNCSEKALFDLCIKGVDEVEGFENMHADNE